MNHQPLVSIVIPNFNARYDLRNCLESLRRLTYGKKEIIVVDSGSTDGSAQIVAEQFPEVVLIKTPKMGIGEANNVGIRAATGSLIVFDLNSDDVVDRNWLAELVKAIDKSPDVGIVCGKRLLGGQRGILDAAGGRLHFLTGTVPAIGRGKRDSARYNVTKEVDYVGVPMVKREVFGKIGLCDQEYYLYYEDTDFCLRAKKAGYRILYVPSAIFTHRLSGTIGKQNPRKHFYERRNRMRFIMKNFSLPILVLPLMLHMVLMTLLNSLYYSLKGDIRYLQAEKNAIVWNFVNARKTIRVRYTANPL